MKGVEIIGISSSRLSSTKQLSPIYHLPIGGKSRCYCVRAGWEGYQYATTTSTTTISRGIVARSTRGAADGVDTIPSNKAQFNA